MKLKKISSRVSKRDGHKFYRYDITIDPELIKDLKWKKGIELSTKVSGKKLIIEKK